MEKESHELLPLARQTASGWISESGSRRPSRSSSQPISDGWSGGNARAENAATARITRLSTAVHNEVRSRAEVKRAQRQEAQLLGNYRRWIKKQNRELCSLKIGALQCDAYEELRHNLIEAKASASREHIRMAVGQLLDYAFQGESQLQASRMAILLPEKPPKDIEAWLDSLNIKLIWSEVPAFLDNANGQFT
jgi:hypothetical protein